MTLILIIIFSVLGSVGAIVTAAIFLLFKEKTQKILIPCLISYATGTLLAAALLGLIPHSLKHITPFETLATVLVGIIFFFLLEKIVIWRHCHNSECIEAHHNTAPMIIIGDAFHNFVDGVVIAASFLISVPLGIAIGVSIIAHEIPQEVGDFGILLHSGYSKKKALLLNTLSSLTTLPAAILAYFALEKMHAITPYIMAISAASFLYIALVDLSPELHRKIGIAQNIRQILLILAGIGTTLIVLQFHP
jgi:zinc and cadmium transporter